MSFQDNFEAFSGKVTEAAQVAAQKAKDLAMIARAKMQILSEEDKIKKAEIEIGKLSYRDFMAGAEAERGEYLPWFEKITESKTAIDELKTTIEAIKNSGEFDDGDIPDVSEDDFADGDVPDITIEVVPDQTDEEAPKE